MGDFGSVRLCAECSVTGGSTVDWTSGNRKCGGESVHARFTWKRIDRNQVEWYENAIS